MSAEDEKPAAEAPPGTKPLNQALDRSERVQTKVDQAASDLSEVNAALKDEIDEIDDGTSLDVLDRALNESEAIEVKVQEAADELVEVNDVLAEEIDERHHLEDLLSQSNAALSKSRDDANQSRHSALHDAVTGLPNLTLFNDRLRHALAQAERHGWRLTVMFVDLDDFKRVNDTHGHALGDRLLQEVARRLQAAARAGDTISRRSGDEFLLLMLEATDDSQVAAFATRIVDGIAEPYKVDGLEFSVRASVGIALYPEDGRSAEELLEHADLAMYAAKQEQKGPVFHRTIAGR